MQPLIGLLTYMPVKNFVTSNLELTIDTIANGNWQQRPGMARNAGIVFVETSPSGCKLRQPARLVDRESQVEQDQSVCVGDSHHPGVAKPERHPAIGHHFSRTA